MNYFRFYLIPLLFLNTLFIIALASSIFSYANEFTYFYDINNKTK